MVTSTQSWKTDSNPLETLLGSISNSHLLVQLYRLGKTARAATEMGVGKNSFNGIMLCQTGSLFLVWWTLLDLLITMMTISACPVGTPSDTIHKTSHLGTISKISQMATTMSLEVSQTQLICRQAKTSGLKTMIKTLACRLRDSNFSMRRYLKL